MSHRDRSDFSRWYGLAGVVGLLAICLILLNGQAATAKTRPAYSIQHQSPRLTAQAAQDAEHLPQPSGSMNPIAPRTEGFSPSHWPNRAGAKPPASVVRDERQPALDLLRARGGAPAFATGNLAQAQQLLAPPMPGEDLAVCMTTDRVWGVLGARQTVTVEVDAQQMGASLADDVGFFWTTLFDANGDRPHLIGGEEVAIYHDGVQAASMTLRSISGQIDLANDIVSGTIGGADFPIDVRVYVGSPEPSMTSYSQTVSTDNQGYFVADFSGVFDLIAWHEAMVTYEDNGVEIHKHVYAPNSLMVRPVPWNGVRGTAPPDTAVVVTLYDNSMAEKETDTVYADEPSGWYYSDLVTDVLPGDTIVVEMAGGITRSRAVDTLNLTVDAVNDTLSGQAQPNSTVRAAVGQLTEHGWRDVNDSTTADSNGDYLIDVSGIVDIMPGFWAAVLVADAEGDDLIILNHGPSVEVNQTWNEVSGAGPADPGPDSEGQDVTVTFASTSTVYHATLGWWGYYYLSRDGDGLPDIVPGEVVTVQMDGYPWQGVVEVQDITAEADLGLDRITGTVVPPSNRVEVSGWYFQNYLYPVAGAFDTIAMASSDFGAEPAGFDVNYHLGYDVSHRTGDDYVNRITRIVDGFAVFRPYSTVVGQMNPPGTPFTITLSDSGGSVKAEIADTSKEPAGDMGWNDFREQEQYIEPGDRVQVQSGAGFSQTVVIPDITILPDLGSGVTSGSAPANSRLLFEVQDQATGFVPTNSSGGFAFAIDQLQDAQEGATLDWGNSIGAWYRDENRTWVFEGYSWPQIVASYDMEGSQQVWGQNASPGSTLFITITHPVSGVIQTGTAVAGACEWCGPGDYQLNLPGGTLEPGNLVTVNFGSDLADFMVVHAVSAEANPNTDVVTVTTEPGTYVFINADGPNGWWDWWWEHDAVEVGPSGMVVFDLSGEYDIVPGTRFNVHVEQAHAHQTHYAFWLPGPDMRVEKWPTGSDQVAPGGPIVYTIRYRNEGDATANRVVLTDTLHPQTTYDSDSSGIAPSVNGNHVVWELGSVQPGAETQFQLLLYNSASSGATLLNQADIWTENDRDPGSNHVEAQVHVVDELGNPNVNKQANPNRPLAGGTYLYEIECGNNGPVAAGPVVLTDNLPDNTHVVDWFSENAYGLWTETSRNGQLVLEAPALPGNWGDRIYLRLSVESGVPYGTQLTNTVELELDGELAWQEHTDVRVDGPYWDSYVGKQFNWGQLVPGGQVEYNVHVRNFGNQPTQTWLTDTLPAGTHFAQSWSWDGQTYEEFPPYDIVGQKVVWNMGQQLPGAWKNVDIRLDIDPGVESGDLLTNCVEIGIDGEDSWPHNNRVCVVDPVRGTGPNLRAYKEHEWQDDNQRLHYQLRVENIGTERFDSILFTDTYPIDTSFHDEWGQQFGPRIELQSHDETNRQLIFWVEHLETGESAGIELRVDLDAPGTPLRSYTNTVEVQTPPGDTNPADNSDVDVAFSGGEVQWVDIDVFRTRIWGCAYATPITIKTASEQMDIDEDRCWDNDFPEVFLLGDIVTITAGAGALPVVIEIPDPFTAYLSSENDEVWGQIDHLDHEMVDVDLWGFPGRRVQTDGDGNYVATYDDIPRGNQADVHYRTEIDHAEVVFHRRADRLDLILNVNYDHDWVEGEYEVDHRVWITVTQSDGSTVKGTAVLTTGLVPWWNGQSGFSTNWHGWTGGHPDIMPGDWVKGRVDNGYTGEVRIGHLTGAMSTLADRIRGTVDAPWIGEEVDIECHPWGSPESAPIKQDTVFPDGEDTYYCSWNPDTEWDVQKEQDLGVSYDEPTGDRVFAVFQIRADVYLPVVLKNH